MIKKKILHILLEESYIQIIVVPWIEEVNLPDYIKDTNAPIILNIDSKGHFAENVELTDEGIEATMTFRGKKTEVSMPWEAIAGVQLPGPDVIATTVTWQVPPKPNTKSKQKSKKDSSNKPHLTLIK